MKTATVRDVYDWLNQIAPFDTAESYDNAGLMLGYKTATKLQRLGRIEGEERTVRLLDDVLLHEAPYISDYI